MSPITREQLAKNVAWLRSKGVEITESQAEAIQACLANGIALPNELAIVAEQVATVCESNWPEFESLFAQ